MPQHGFAFLTLYVQLDAALIPASHQKENARILVEEGLGARPMALIGASNPLNLHDVRAKVGQELNARRPLQIMREAHNLNAVEGSDHFLLAFLLVMRSAPFRRKNGGALVEKGGDALRDIGRSKDLIAVGKRASDRFLRCLGQ